MRDVTAATLPKYGEGEIDGIWCCYDAYAQGVYQALVLSLIHISGSASILGLMNDRDNRVQLLIDEDVLKGEYIGCHPCINTSSLRISTKAVSYTHLGYVHKHVDNVDNLVSEKLFSYIYNVSGPHSYQQVTLCTIFK